MTRVMWHNKLLPRGVSAEQADRVEEIISKFSADTGRYYTSTMVARAVIRAVKYRPRKPRRKS